jgi:kallikrein
VPSNYLIRAGEWDRSSTLEYLQHQDRSVAQIVSHPQYYSGGLFNDIAILKWTHPLRMDLNIQPICLPDENQVVKEGTKCIVTAWGKTSESSPTTDKLKFVKIPVVGRSKCEKQLQDYRLGSHFKLHESFICAGGEEGLDSCQNDGGSPMICKHENDDSYFLSGLVSWGLDCAVKNVPGVYTNVPNLMGWIRSHTVEK